MECQTTARAFSVRATGPTSSTGVSWSQFLDTHSNAVANFLAGTHVVINARNDVSSHKDIYASVYILICYWFRRVMYNLLRS